MSVPVQGQLVEVRSRRFVVTEVEESDLPAEPGAVQVGQRQHLVSLSAVDDEGAGEQLQVVWEIEPGARPDDVASLPDATGFDEPRRLDAFLNALRWGAVASADHRALHAPFRSGITLEDYQLDPVVRALQMPRVNLLVADDVGLGKTIEAGLVVQELLLRHRARSVLVVCPAGLQLQWRDQMRDKFGLEFRIVDSAAMKDLRRRRGLFVNPWTHFPRLITSIDFLKRELPMRLFREILPTDGKATFPRKFDLLIVDEAHNVAPSNNRPSHRTAAIRTLAPHFEHKLFLSATPHNGYVESFAALLELLDDQRFHHRVRPDPQQLKAIMVRRLKSELPPQWDGTPRFPKRVLNALEVDYTDAEREAHQTLRRYASLRRENAKDDAEKSASEFVLKLLKRRLFSSPAAFLRTIDKHRQTLTEGPTTSKRPRRRPSMSVLARHFDELEDDFEDEDALELAVDEAIEASARTFSPLSPAEEEILDELRAWAEPAASRRDAKAKRLIDWVTELVKPDGKWNDRRVIIFTEYRDTQKWLHDQLAQAGLAQGGRLEMLYGGMLTEDREKVKAAFQASPADAEVRILLATDAASEGIDLQNHCAHLVHYEIPWNPNRLEQRNGRIDRHGQRAPEVHVQHFVASGYQGRGLAKKPGDLEGDLEFLFVAAQKVENIREDLGKVGPVIADQVAEAMLGHRAHLDTTQAEHDATAARRLLRIERKLREEIERLRETLRESREQLQLSPANVQAVVETALSLARQPALVEAELDGVWPDPKGARKICPVFRLPPLTGSWARAAEGLAHPHTGDVRPIVFDHDLARGRDDVVLAHLGHRLVQMSLQLLRAEVWSPDGKLHRVVARRVPANALDTPVAVAHARLVVLGGDNAKLHEELVFAGGRLVGGKLERLNQTDTKAAIDSATGEECSEGMKARLEGLWPDVRKPMEKALEARKRDRVKSVDKLLAARAQTETDQITSLLEELERNLRAELKTVEVVQPSLFDQNPLPGIERTRSAVEARLDGIPAEIERETEAITRRYAEPSAQLFPVSVTFLVPAHLDG